MSQRSSRTSHKPNLSRQPSEVSQETAADTINGRMVSAGGFVDDLEFKSVDFAMLDGLPDTATFRSCTFHGCLFESMLIGDWEFLGCRFDSCSLRGARFLDGAIKDCTFSDCNGHASSLPLISHTTFKGVTLTDAEIFLGPRPSFLRCNLDRAVMAVSESGKGVSFSESSLKSTKILPESSGISLVDAGFAASDLEDCIFGGFKEIAECDLRGIDVSKAGFDGKTVFRETQTDGDSKLGSWEWQIKGSASALAKRGTWGAGGLGERMLLASAKTFIGYPALVVRKVADAVAKALGSK